MIRVLLGSLLEAAAAGIVLFLRLPLKFPDHLRRLPVAFARADVLNSTEPPHRLGLLDRATALMLR